MKSAIPLTVALIAALSGCATAPQIRYDTSGSLDDVLNARQQCAQELAGGGSGLEGGGGSTLMRAPGCSEFTRCVEDKGHRRDPYGRIILPANAVIACTPP